MSFPAVSAAHGVLPFGIDVFLDDRGAPFGGLVSHGLLEADGDASTWTPEDAIDGWLLWGRFIEGRAVVGTDSGLFESSNWGCDWARVSGPLSTRWTTRPSETSDGRIWLGTVDDGAENGIYWSDDGVNWALEPLAVPERVSAVKAAGDDVWALLESADEQSLHLRRMGEWSTVAEGLSGWSIGGADSSGVLRIGVSSGFDTLDLMEVDGSGEATLLAQVPGASLTSAVSGREGLIVLVDRVSAFEVIGGAAQVVEDGPSFCLADRWVQGRLWGCAERDDGVHFRYSTDGREWLDYLPLDRVCPAQCAEGSTSREWLDTIQPFVYATGVGDPSCFDVDEAVDAGVTQADAGVSSGGGSSDCSSVGRGTRGGWPIGGLCWMLGGLALRRLSKDAL